MAKIGEKTLEAVTEQIGKLLQSYRGEIDEAFQLEDAKFFPVTLTAKFGVGKGDGVYHFPAISFTKEKIKDAGPGQETDENGPVGDALFDAQERMDAEDRAERERERARIREILFRDFRPFARLIGSVLAKWRRAYQNVGAILFRKHLKI